MQVDSTIAWLAKCGATAALLLLACGLATARFGAGLQLPATTTRDGTLITLNRYVSEPIPDVVLVGSSVSFRLKEELFRATKIRNLGLAGGSPVTGLEIVANRKRVPRIILVETNVLSRPVDAELVARYSQSGANEPLLFRPLRVAVAAYENWNHAPISPAQASAALDRLIRQPPSDFDNQVYVARAVQQSNAEDTADAVRANVKRIGELIAALVQRGAQVLLVEVPYSKPISESRASRITHEVVQAGFPDPARWLQIYPPTNELRWLDGVHLDERSAALVAQAIEQAISALPRDN